MDLSLIETLRWEPATGFVRLERHLARLARSAAALGLPGAEDARGALLSALKAEGGEPYQTPLRIRLELFPDSRIDIQTALFTPLAQDATWRIKLAATRLSSTDLLLHHKTSRRAAYAAARSEFSAARREVL